MSNLTGNKFVRILESVRKPSTYLGVEPNSAHKNYDEIKGSMALVFPDLYEIGMSHLGLKILYNIINQEPDLAAERAFAPGDDFAEALLRENAPLMSLETKRPLADFDIVGFTIPYELSYTTILWILKLAGIPLRAVDRDKNFPFVIGGGAGVYNPEPIADFFDFFILGDGEEIVTKVLREVVKDKREPRFDTLKRLSKIPGVYVPSFFDVSYHPDGKIDSVTPILPPYDKAKRIFLPTLSESVFPVDMVVPIAKTIQERLTVEIDRGCTQGCRFCQAGTTYRPARERTPDEVMEIIEQALRKTGYGGVSLSSLSAGDYSKIEELLTLLMDRYENEKVSLSLPSLRSNTVTSEIIREIGRVKKSGFTITAEAGSARLRNVLNKKVSDEAILRVATNLLSSGWRSLKLYFMIGLPTETDEDIEAIALLSEKLAALKINNQRFKNINISVSNFVPKAHTAFQWFGQDPVEIMIAKKEKLFSLIKKNRRLRLKWHDARMSQLEAVFSQGDRRLSKVVESAFHMGRRLDAWTEHFDYDAWMEAFEANEVDPAFYASRHVDINETLPWDHIDTGLTKKYFKREWKHALNAEMTEDCKTGKCIGCGIDPDQCFENYEWTRAREITPAIQKSEIRIKYRLLYEKTGLSRFISHLELQSLFTRALRMIDAPVKYSEGFSPHPRISFGGALPVGTESVDETFDVELAEQVERERLISSLNAHMPDGILLKKCEELKPGTKSISASITAFDYLVTLDESIDLEYAKSAITQFDSAKSIFVIKGKSGEKRIDIKPITLNLALVEKPLGISFRLIVTKTGTARPSDLLTNLFPEHKRPASRILKIKSVMDNLPII